jgi:hypothetical protein
MLSAWLEAVSLNFSLANSIAVSIYAAVTASTLRVLRRLQLFPFLFYFLDAEKFNLFQSFYVTFAHAASRTQWHLDVQAMCHF